MPVENEHFVAEALRIVEEAESQAIKLRILGSLAYRIHCPQNLELFAKMERALTDIDFAGEKRQTKQIKQFLIASGYVEDQRMTVSTEGNRYYFEHPETKLGVDVFMNELYFCHRIPFDGRLDLDKPTISTADLLLEKMQIVELNLKDITDTMVLLLEHPIGTAADGPEAIDGAYIADLLHDDWGFYYTVTTNLAKVGSFLPENSALDAAQAEVIRGRLEEVGGLIEAAPKARRWRMRAKVGTKRQWYQDVAPKGSGF
ncbi:MAG: hypothetical protein M3076_11300 [Actinomycetota bacterium]|nr:hypothetical protein [Actinomycetota bacterium]